MSVNGVWTGEVFSPFGWESRGVYILENGRIIGGDHRQYSTGTYSISQERFTAKLVIHYYGPPRTVFGEKTVTYAAELEGELGENVMNGTIRRPDKDGFELQMRLTRRMDLPVS